MDLFSQMSQLLAAGTPFVLATVVETGGSCPQKPGAKLLVLPDGSLRGTVGGGAIEHLIVQEARALLADAGATTRLTRADLPHDLGMCCGGTMGVFLEKLAPGERLVIFGAGHVGKALSELAQAAGFLVTVVDARAEWLSAERFPRAHRLLGDPLAEATSLATDDATFVCVMTHDHGLDQDLVQAMVDRPHRYLGMIGSERKAAKLRSRLKELGVAAERIASTRSPMGIAIGAQSPEEIAVSIVAELVAVRHGKHAT
jgi:xanthine dehydrogenase accessory factor